MAKYTQSKPSQKVSVQTAAWIIGVATCVFVIRVVLIVLNSGQAAAPGPTPTPTTMLLLPTQTPEPEVTAEATPADTAEADAEPVEGTVPEDPAERNGMYTDPPPMVIDPAKRYTAVIETEKGDIVATLYADKAPNTVNNFVFLAREGFYDNTTFHRVIEGFMAQAGDPTGTGTGGPGYRFADEFHPDLRHDSAGILSMANSGPGTNGSQFFITFAETPWLDDMHSVFGKVSEGMDVLMSISIRDPQTATTPGDLIKTIRIEEQ